MPETSLLSFTLMSTPCFTAVVKPPRFFPHRSSSLAIIDCLSCASPFAAVELQPPNLLSHASTNRNLAIKH
uniref:Uncharacterized protein n=1 Tax=Cucumis melo TaxID=3656 RepID=A0A9I9ELR9_CUCME